MKKSKFNSVFAKDVQRQKTPEALKRYLNQDAPKGYHYKRLGDTNTYSLRKDGNDEQYTFIVRFTFPFEFEGLTIRNLDELLEAMYRLQKPYKIDDEMQENPPTLKVLNGKVENRFILPYPFEKVGPIKVKYGKKEKEIGIRRVPYSNFRKSKFVSVEESLLFLELIIDEKTFKVTINAKLNFSAIKSIDNYFMNREFIRAFNYSEMSMAGKQLIIKTDAREVFDRNDKLFNALKLIQDRIGKKIVFPQQIQSLDMLNVKALFESLINRRPVELRQTADIEFTFDPEKMKVQDKRKSIGKHMKVYLPIRKSISLLDTEVELFAYYYYSDLQLKEIKPDTNQIVFTPAEGNRSFVYYETERDFQDLDGSEFETKLVNSIFSDDVDFTVLN